MRYVKKSTIELAISKGFKKESENVLLTDLQDWLISIDEPIWFGQKEGSWTWFGEYGEYGFKDFNTHWEALEEGIVIKLKELKN